MTDALTAARDQQRAERERADRLARLIYLFNKMDDPAQEKCLRAAAKLRDATDHRRERAIDAINRRSGLVA
jgi:hypothetical protein